MDIEKEIFPEANKLIVSEDNKTATIVDEELDPIECTFNGDGCVQLNTDEYKHIILSVDDLERLIDLIEEYEINPE